MSCRIRYDFIAQTRTLTADEPSCATRAAAPALRRGADILRPNDDAERMLALHLAALSAARPAAPRRAEARAA